MITYADSMIRHQIKKTPPELFIRQRFYCPEGFLQITSMMKSLRSFQFNIQEEVQMPGFSHKPLFLGPARVQYEVSGLKQRGTFHLKHVGKETAY